MSFVPGDRHRFGLVLSFPLADNLVLTQYDEAPYVRGLLRNDQAIDGVGEAGDRRVRHPDAVGDRRRRRRCPAATSRRRSSPASSAASCRRSSSTSRRAASTSAASSSSTARSSRSATRARRSCSCRPSSTRSSSCRTAIAVMYRGEIVALVDGPTAEREEVGLLMAAGRRSDPAGREPRRRRRAAARRCRPDGHARAGSGRSPPSRSSRSSSPCCSARS